MANTVELESLAIGRAVRGAIAMAGLSLAEASTVSGISSSTLSRRLNGATAFSFSELVRIARACGVKVSDLVRDAERIAAHQLAQGLAGSVGVDVEPDEPPPSEGVA